MPRCDVMPQPKKVNWRGVVHDACHRKTAYPNEGAALRERDRLRDGLYVYRCPFSDGGRRHYHLAHPPNMRTLRKIASAIRARAQEAGHVFVGVIWGLLIEVTAAVVALKVLL